RAETPVCHDVNPSHETMGVRNGPRVKPGGSTVVLATAIPPPAMADPGLDPGASSVPQLPPLLSAERRLLTSFRQRGDLPRQIFSTILSGPGRIRRGSRHAPGPLGRK